MPESTPNRLRVEFWLELQRLGFFVTGNIVATQTGNTRAMIEHPRKPDTPRSPEKPDIVDAQRPDIAPAPPPDIPPQPLPDRPDPQRDTPGPR
jgi:hypothetical protein